MPMKVHSYIYWMPIYLDQYLLDKIKTGSTALRITTHIIYTQAIFPDEPGLNVYDENFIFEYDAGSETFKLVGLGEKQQLYT